MTSRAARSVLPFCIALPALVGAAPAAADDVIAELTRDTPIAAYGGVVAWSDHDAATGRYRLVIRQGDQAAPAPIAGSRRAFDVSLGPDARGRVVALYTRCRTTNRGCDVYRYDVKARREHKVVSVSSPVKDEAWPVQWRDRVAFVRRARAYVVLDGYSPRPDPRGKRGGGPLMDCDIPYVKTLSARAPSRRLDRGLCAPTTGMSIRRDRIVQVTDLDQGGAGSETQVRVLRAHGGPARVLAHAPGGEGGYSPFSSPNQSASAVWLTRTGNREPLDFLRVDIASRRLTAVHPNVPLAGRVARDERGTFWYVQAPEPPEEYYGEPPFCVSPLEPCRLIRSSASPFSSATRALPPQLRLSVGAWRDISGLFTDPPEVSGDLTRTTVRRSTIMRREPLRAVSLELLRSDRPEGRGPFAPTGLVTTTDQAGRWSFPLGQPPSRAYFAAVARGIGIASRAVAVTASARVTLTVGGSSLGGTVTPAQPGRTVRIQRLEADGIGKLPNGQPRCQPPNAAGERFCLDEAWINVATPPLDADGTAFSVSVDRPGFYRADLPVDEKANPGIYGGRSPEVRVVG